MTPEAAALAADRRWQRFTARDYLCPCCGQPSTGLYDLGFDHPDPWPHGNRAAAGEDTLVVGADRLGTDLCTFDGGFYIRCTLPLPIRGGDQVFAFGPWASVSDASFARYVAAWRAEDYSDFPGCFAWLANALPGIASVATVPCKLEIGDGTARPQLFAQSAAQGLAGLQRDGISFDRLLDIYAAAGNDLRPHLGEA
ncbi:MAG: DUF2199 domain-containing protein [Paracoccaceae bacterium]